jgi:hypothetical protein
MVKFENKYFYSLNRNSFSSFSYPPKISLFFKIPFRKIVVRPYRIPLRCQMYAVKCLNKDYIWWNSRINIFLRQTDYFWDDRFCSFFVLFVFCKKKIVIFCSTMIISFRKIWATYFAKKIAEEQKIAQLTKFRPFRSPCLWRKPNTKRWNIACCLWMQSKIGLDRVH